MRDAEIEIGVPGVFAIVPEVRRSKKSIECGLAGVALKGVLQLGLDLRDSAVLIAVIDTPESFDRSLAGTSIRLAILVG
jgi:hypothetical protein